MITLILLSLANQFGLWFENMGISPLMEIISLVLCLTLILIYAKCNTMIEYKEERLISI